MFINLSHSSNGATPTGVHIFSSTEHHHSPSCAGYGHKHSNTLILMSRPINWHSLEQYWEILHLLRQRTRRVPSLLHNKNASREDIVRLLSLRSFWQNRHHMLPHVQAKLQLDTPSNSTEKFCIYYRQTTTRDLLLLGNGDRTPALA